MFCPIRSESVFIGTKSLPLPGPGGEALYKSCLLKIAQAVTDQARNWDSPVTITWVMVADTPTRSLYFPPIEFSQRLVKNESNAVYAKHRTPHLQSFQDLQMFMKSCARGLAAGYGKYTSTNISGTLTLALAASRPQEKKIVVVFSDFVDCNSAGTTSSLPLMGARVLMVYRSAPTDGLNGNARSARVQAWKERLRESGASSVCTIPMEAVTINDLRNCL